MTFLRPFSAFQVLDNISYPPTRNGRAPFVPLGVNSCPALVLASEDSPQRIDWCRNTAANLNNSAIDTGTKYMASGYVVSPDGAQLSLCKGFDIIVEHFLLLFFEGGGTRFFPLPRFPSPILLAPRCITCSGR